MTVQYYVVFCTCPNNEVAKDLAKKVVLAKLAACVNIVPGLTSIYTFENKIETSSESLLIIKTTEAIYSKLETMLVENHPYQCPEVIGLPIELGSKGYLQWLKNSVLPVS